MNAYNPGFMPDTGLGKTENKVQFVLMKILSVIGNVFGFATSAETSAQYVVRLIVDEKESGKYFDKDKAISSSIESYDEAKAKSLWQESERLIEKLLKMQK